MRKIIRTCQAIESLWLWLTHYRVIAYWDGLVKTHYAKDMDEVFEWMRTYGHDAVVIAYGKRLTLLGGRYAG